MGNANYFAEGDWNAACAECGRKFKASELIQLPPGVAGSGLYVCRAHWNPRQPQDYVRGIQENPQAPWVQPVLTSSSVGVLGGPGGSIIDVSTVFIDIPWVPGGSTINNFVLTDYATADQIAVGGTITVNIPADVTITGSFSFGTGWPPGTTFIVNNNGSVTVTPDIPANTNVVVNGVPLGKPVTNPTYTIKWQMGIFPAPVLVFNVQPTDTGPNTSISPAIEVWVVGNLSVSITNLTLNIMMTIGINPGSPPGVLSGTTTQTTVNGIATFSDLKIDQTGNGYVLIASVV